jgi:hypothetical protein
MTRDLGDRVAPLMDDAVAIHGHGGAQVLVRRPGSVHTLITVGAGGRFTHTANPYSRAEWRHRPVILGVESSPTVNIRAPHLVGHAQASLKLSRCRNERELPVACCVNLDWSRWPQPSTFITPRVNP